VISWMARIREVLRPLFEDGIVRLQVGGDVAEAVDGVCHDDHVP